ncbi:MAG: DUF4190 domain-containing protein [Deltaproteobacteria bacterium]|nr:DUF4190 domain-containing protein [Deltaproteobacteria bacterium]
MRTAVDKNPPLTRRLLENLTGWVDQGGRAPRRPASPGDVAKQISSDGLLRLPLGQPPPGGGFNNPYQPAGPGSYGGGGFDQQDPNYGKVPGIVIAGFILSFLCSLVGLILCIIGLKEAKQRQAGEGLAIAGIVIAILMMVLGFAMQIAAR